MSETSGRLFRVKRTDGSPALIGRDVSITEEPEFSGDDTGRVGAVRTNYGVDWGTLSVVVEAKSLDEVATRLGFEIVDAASRLPEGDEFAKACADRDAFAKEWRDLVVQSTKERTALQDALVLLEDRSPEVISLGHVSSKDLRDRYLAAGDRQNARVALILRLRELLEVADFNAEDMKVAAAMVVAAQERVPERASEPGCVAMPARVPRSLVDGNCKAHGYWNSASGEGCPTCVVVSKKGGAS